MYGARPYQGKTQPQGSSRGAEAPACSGKPLLAALEPAGLRHSLALPSSGVPASPAASPSLRVALLMIIYSDASEILRIISNPPSARFVSHPQQPEEGGGFCWKRDRSGNAWATSPLSSPGEMPSLVTAIKIGSNELEAIPQTVFVLSIPTIFTNCFLHKYLPTPSPFNSEKDGKGQALPPAGQPAAMEPHS